jgi:hypothetical protein
MSFAKRVYLIAGIYGLIVMLPQYFLENKNGRDFPPAITHPEYYYGFVGITVAWQVAFLVMSRDPIRYRPMMIPTILEKASWAFAAIALFLLGKLSTPMLGAGLLDLTLGVLFVMAYARTAQEASAQTPSSVPTS